MFYNGLDMSSGECARTTISSALTWMNTGGSYIYSLLSPLLISFVVKFVGEIDYFSEDLDEDELESVIFAIKELNNFLGL